MPRLEVCSQTVFHLEADFADLDFETLRLLLLLAALGLAEAAMAPLFLPAVATGAMYM